MESTANQAVNVVYVCMMEVSAGYAIHLKGGKIVILVP